MGISKFKALSIAAAVSVALAGCSATDNEEPTVSLSGVVADGYLQDALVCLDMNNNKACDSNEPQATTDSDGKYSFTASEGDSKTYPVISVIEPGVTKDADNLNRVLKAYVMSAPAGKPDWISPMTTMIQTEIESNKGMSVESAESRVKTNLGYSATSAVSLFKDYVAAKDDTTSETAENRAQYKRIHQIAQVTARTLEENHTAIQDAATLAGEDKDALLNELVRILVKQVIENMAAITAAVDSGNSVDGNGEFSADVATTTAGINVNTDNLADDLAAEQTASTASPINIASILTAGIHVLGSTFITDVASSTYKTRTIKATTTGGIVVTGTTWNGTDWVEDPDTGDTNDTPYYNQVLTSTGLLRYNSNIDAETFSDNGDGTATLKEEDGSGNIISKYVMRGVELSLAGKRIRSTLDHDWVDGNHKAWEKATPGNAVFGAGAKGYRWNFTSANDVYYVRYNEASTGNSCSTDFGTSNTLTSANCTALKNTAGYVAATSFSDITDGTAIQLFGASVTAAFTAGTTSNSGTVVYSYMDGLVTKTIDGTYSINMPLGGSVEALEFNVPKAIQDAMQLGDTSQVFIIIDEGFARMGTVEPAGITQPNDSVYYSLAALEGAKDCFMGGTVTANIGTCPVELFLRDGNITNADDTVDVSFDTTKTLQPFNLAVAGTTMDLSTDGTAMRIQFVLSNTDLTSGWKSGTFDSASSAVDPINHPNIRWKVTGNGRLKIEQLVTGTTTNEIKGYWMITQLAGETDVHVRRKRVDGTKNFGGFMTILP